MAWLLKLKNIFAKLLILLFIIIAVVPIITMIIGTIFNDRNFDFAAYQKIFSNLQNWRLLRNSLTLGLSTALFALAVGIPLGYFLGKTDLPFKSFFKIGFLIPLFFPPYILSIAWSHILGKQGLLQTLFGVGSFTSDFLFSLPGAAFVLTNIYYPLVMLICLAAFYGIDRSFEDEALLHTGERKILSRILLPLILPFLKAAFLFVFIIALSEFGVPAFLGTNVYTVEILTQFSAFYDFQTATAHAVILVFVALVIVISSRKLVNRISTGIMESLGYANYRIINLKRWKIPVLILVSLAFFFFVLLPLAVLVCKSLPLNTYIQAFNLASSGILHSLLWSGIGATTLVLFGFVFGYFRIREHWQSINPLTLFTFAIPSTVLGIGLISLWNRGAPFYFVYNSILMVLFVYIARFVFITQNVISGAISQIPVSYEEAAFLEGGGRFKIIGKIIIPLSKPALIAAWILGFIFCFGEIGATLLVYPPGSSTLPIKIFTITANSPENLAAALCMLLVLIILISLGVFFLTLKSFRKNLIML